MASVFIVLMLLTLGVSVASACQAEESPAYSDQNSLFPGDCDQNCLEGETFPLPANEAVSCNGGCDKAACTGDCCENCTENCSEADSTGSYAPTECKGGCYDDYADVCEGADCTGACCDMY